MQCSNCQAVNDGDAMFCVHCGAQLQMQSQVQGQDFTQTQPLYQQNMPQQSPMQTQVQDQLPTQPQVQQPYNPPVPPQTPPQQSLPPQNQAQVQLTQNLPVQSQGGTGASATHYPQQQPSVNTDTTVLPNMPAHSSSTSVHPSGVSFASMQETTVNSFPNDMSPTGYNESTQPSVAYPSVGIEAGADVSDTEKASGKKKALIASILVVALVVVIGGGYGAYRMFSGDDKSSGGKAVAHEVQKKEYVDEVQKAVDDGLATNTMLMEAASALLNAQKENSALTKDSLGEYYANIASETKELMNALDTASQSFETNRAVIDNALKSKPDDEGLQRYQAAFQDLSDISTLEKELVTFQIEYFSAFLDEESDWNDMLDRKQKFFSELQIPLAFQTLIETYYKASFVEEEASMKYASMYDNAASEADRSPIEMMQANELILMSLGDSAMQEHKMLDVSYRALDYASKLLEGKKMETEVDVETVSIISPNLYQSLPSLVEIAFKAPVAQDIIIEVEVPGFTQKYEEKISVHAGLNYFSIKPPVLTDLKRGDLTSSKETTISVKVTDSESGNIIEQKSPSVTLQSLYDMTWPESEYGTPHYTNLLAWLRPEDEGVHALVREAADILNTKTNGYYSAMNGYQSDRAGQWAQVAAIQEAISRRGVLYTMDNFSFSGSQHVLTPDQVLAQKHGLCAETTFLVASALKSLKMDVMLVFPKGHAQVAVRINDDKSDTYRYFLVETTILPYEMKVNGTRMEFGNLFVIYDNADWADRIQSGELLYVVDARLIEEMQIQGLSVSD